MSPAYDGFTKARERVLVISGGGARGAWGGGLIQALSEKEKPNYHCIVGNSTGSLLAPLVAIDDFATLKEAFTNLSMKDIFNVNPFRDNGDLNPVNAILRILCGEENLGESYSLKRKIAYYFTSNVYNEIKKRRRTVKVSVVSLSSNEVKFMSVDDHNHNDMIDWLWASANQPVFMTAVDKNKHKWVDGGIKENVPISEGLEYAKNHNIKDIDVIVNNLNSENKKPWPQDNNKTNIIPKLLRVINWCL